MNALRLQSFHWQGIQASLWASPNRLLHPGKIIELNPNENQILHRTVHLSTSRMANTGKLALPLYRPVASIWA
jgi:hypothetical protein